MHFPTITVFSTPTCPHCLKLKTLISTLPVFSRHPLNVIDIAGHPYRRSDMLTLSQRFTVPQCFVGSTHIGGLDDFLKLTHDGDNLKPNLPFAFSIESELPYALRAVDPSLKVEIPPPPPYANALPNLSEKIDTVRKCNSVDVYEPLLMSGNMSNELKTPGVLNCAYRYNDRTDPHPDLLVQRLKSKLDTIISEYTTNLGVDYPGIKSSSEFLKFEIGTSELQSVSFKGLDDGCKKSVVINLYNLMIKHAFTKVGIPTDKENRGAFFTTVGYVFKDGFYSFDHLENGILRSNRNGILKVGDSRFATIFEDEKVDNRIHFALNCGAKSCPPIKKFTKEAVEEELEVTAKGYCEDDGNVEVEGGTVRLNMIFNWYGKDFGETDLEKATTISKWCVGEKKVKMEEALKREDFKIDYFVYDWGCDGVKPDVRFQEGTGFTEEKWE